PCRTPAELATRLRHLLDEPPLRRQLGAIGQRRMGPAGGSSRLAALLEQRLLAPPGPAAGGLG
ncbi:MAG: lipid-A-disaccharide synthase-related protein, partial [Prochlorococcaceae cyanobacterium]